ncbi:hypothetical protein HELRODRAFT_184997 [Helobdella robusta]|uniref:ubiquitinyl hydrolase 1 n=1 Tax=Helobdella robusta TaxID=6412 RepID=T1FM90_HELRO|nr:hypothetical protein HELRODRAFT_184997 [Helobdella robusta]ESO02538.1 hypothetical protein HELRODRAFT_184997 [Helobdella robusta]
MAEHTDFHYNSDVNYDEATMRQQRDIEEEIMNSQLLIGELEDLGNLETEMASDDIFVRKVQILKQRYSNFRRVRGDGNCFYRAFGFACLENFLDKPEECLRFRDVATGCKDELVSLGFPECTVEDFYTVFVETLDLINSEKSLEKLLEVINDQSTSDYIVVFLRLLVSGHLQQNSDFYSCFLEDHKTMKDFCSQEVEPMNKESDQIHVIALTTCTNIGVRIEYLDRSDSLNNHVFPDNLTPSITLMYRPGHYDILYK